MKNKKVKRKSGSKTLATLPFELQQFRDDLKDHIEMPVDVKANKSGKGQIVIKFKSEKELKELADRLGL